MTRPPLQEEHFLTRIKRALFLTLFLLPVVILSFSSATYAADIQAVLDSTGGGSAFVVQDLNAVNTVASISSAGNVGVSGCLRIDGSLTPCTQDLSLIVDEGNIGIGSSEPRYRLEISGEMNLFSPGSFYRVGGVGILTNTGGVGGDTVVQAAVTQGIRFLPDGTEAMRITSAGNVGIGSAVPESRFDVTGGSGRFLTGMSAPNVNGALTPGSLYIQEDLEVDGNVYLGDQVTVDNIVVTGTLSLAGSTGYDGPLTITTDDTHALLVRRDAGTQIFNIDTTNAVASHMGNLGVGTTLPAVRLQVGAGSPLFPIGPESLLVKSDLEVDGNVYLGSASTNTLTVTGLLTLSGDTNYNGPITITTTDTNTLLILQDGGTQILNVDTQNALMSMMGNVGIGTTMPIGRLDVKGGRVIVGPATTTRSTAGGTDLFVAGNISADANIYATDATFTGVSTLGNLQANVNTIEAVNAGGGVSILESSGTGITLAFQGNVGIGSTLPESRLDVMGGAARILSGAATPSVDLATTAGSLYVQDNFEVDGNVYLGDAFTDNLVVTGSLTLGGDTSYTGPVTISTTDAGAFIVRQEGGGTQVFNVDTITGNVGIGSALPGQALDVAGAVRSGQVIDSGLTAGRITYAGTGGLLADNANLVFNGTNVGIGGGVPVQLLDVRGNTYIAGNVGIGSSAPEAKLDVIGGVTRVLTGGVAPGVDYATTPGSLYIQQDLEVDGNVYLGDAMTDNLIVSGSLTLGGNTRYTGPVTISTTDAGALVVRQQSDGTQIFNVDTVAGNVGIGSAVPRQTLDVDGTLYASGAVTLGSTLGVGGNLDINGAANDIAGTLNLSGNALTSSGALSVTPAAGTNLNIALSGAGDLAINTDQFYVDTLSANVGIGSSLPGARLDVVGGAVRILSGAATPSVDLATTAGSLYVQDNFEVDGNVYLGDAFTDNLVVTGSLTLGGDTSYTGPVTISTTDAGAFIVRQEGSGTQVFNVNTVTGNVGVGSAIPGQALDVAGTIRGDEIIDSGLTAGRITYAGTGGQLADNANLVFNGTNVGIGGGAPVQLLDVRGNTYIAGNVGIGSSAPEAQLDVIGGVTRILIGGVPPTVGHATIPGSLYIQQDLEVDGNVYLGDAMTDNLIVSGSLTLGGNTTYTGPVTISTTDAGALVVRQTSSGTQIFNVDTVAGNVGIGSAVPGQTLDVAGTIRGDQIIDSGLTATRITYAGTAGQLVDNENLVFSGSNVGIGTSAPASRLDVVGGAARVLESAGTANVGYATTSGSLYVQNDLEVDGNVYLGDALADNLIVAGSLTLSGNTSYGGPVSISTTDAEAFVVRQQNDGTQIFNVDTAAGNVGIGSAVPGQALDVAGAIRGDEIIDSGLTAGRITYAGTGGQLVDNASLVFDGTNVGIGSAVPVARLDVDGTLYASGAVTLGSTLGVAGNLDINGAANDIAGTLNLSGSALTSSGALSVTPAAGTNLNIALSGAGDLSVNTDQLYVDTLTGNVGIGTSAPASRMDVVGGAARVLASPGTANVGYATASGSLYVQNDLEVDGNVYLGDALADNLVIIGSLTLSGSTHYTGPVTISTTHAGAFIVRQQNDGTQIFNVDTVAGNVGIGSAIPRQTLDVAGTFNATGAVTLGSTLGVAGSLDVNGAANDIAGTLNLSGNALTSSGALSVTPAAGTNLNIALSGAGDLAVNTDQLYLDTLTGNVGIGTSAPASRLDVVGGAARVLESAGTANVGYATTSGSLYVQNDLEVDGNVYLGDALADNLIVAGSLTLSGNTSYGGPVSISTTDAGAFVVRQQNDGTQIFNVDTVAGNVGIGSAIPGQTLDVAGTIRAGEIIDSGLTAGRITYAGTAGQLVDSAGLVFNGTNVGIGSAVPMARLDVDGTLYASGAVTLGSTLGVAGNLDVNGAANDIAGTLNLSGSALTSSGALSVTPAAGTNLNIALSGAGDLSVNTSQLYVQTLTGNVGIGSAIPIARLDIQGGDLYLGTGTRDYMTAGPDMYVQNNLEVDGTVYATLFIGTLDLGFTQGSVIFDNGGGLAQNNADFFWDNATSRLGIGTSSPLYSLDVDGTVYASGAVVLGSTLGVTGNLDVNGAANDIAGTLNLSGNALTSSGALSVTPAAGTNLNISLSGAGDLAVNTDQIYVDTLTGSVGIGSSLPGSRLDVVGIERVISGTSTPNVGYATTPGSLYVQHDLEVDGNVYLGDALADNLIVAGSLTLSGTTNYSGPVTISTTNAGAFVVRQQNNGTQIFNVDTVAGNVGVSGDFYVLNDIVFDGRIYGDGSELTGINEIAGLTDNYIPRALGAVALEDSIMYDNGANIGISSASPGKTLDVVGNIRASGNVGIGTAIVDSDDAPRIIITSTAVEISLQ